MINCKLKTIFLFIRYYELIFFAKGYKITSVKAGLRWSRNELSGNRVVSVDRESRPGAQVLFTRGTAPRTDSLVLPKSFPDVILI